MYLKHIQDKEYVHVFKNIFKIRNMYMYLKHIQDKEYVHEHTLLIKSRHHCIDIITDHWINFKSR